MKKAILLLCLFLTGIFAYPQRFMHGAGIGIFVATVAGSDPTVTGGLTYSPRFNFFETENLSVSVGIPISLGASASYNSTDVYGTSSAVSLMVNAPLLVNLNMGAGSTKENEDRFGFFVGAGFGYHFGSFNESVSDGYGGSIQTYTSVNTFGPAADAGVRFAVGRHQKNIEVRLSFLKGIDQSNANVFGLGTLFNF